MKNFKRMFLCMTMALVCIIQPMSVFAGESITDEGIIIERGLTEEGIPYTVRQTIVEVPTTVPFKAPISVFVTRVVVYGPFKSMDEGRAFTNYPSSVSWTEDIGAATMARGTLYFASKSVYGGSSAKYSVEIKYEGYLTAQS